MSAEPRLLFVYNADSGLFNALADIGHKIFSPQTYDCRLCGLTHGVLTEHKAWRAFVEGLPVACTFLHRDEFHRRYPSAGTPALPAVFRLLSDGPVVCVDASTLNACSSLEQLQTAIRRLCLDRTDSR